MVAIFEQAGSDAYHLAYDSKRSRLLMWTTLVYGDGGQQISDVDHLAIPPKLAKVVGGILFSANIRNVR